MRFSIYSSLSVGKSIERNYAIKCTKYYLFLRERQSEITKGKHATRLKSLPSILRHFPINLLVKTVSMKCSFYTSPQNAVNRSDSFFFSKCSPFFITRLPFVSIVLSSLDYAALYLIFYGRTGVPAVILIC